MPPFVCLLRGINVGGHRKMSMSDLRTLVESLACKEVQTYLQSGNLVFKATGSRLKIRDNIARSIHDEFGCEVLVFLYTKSEYDDIVAANPFSSESELDSKFQHVTFVDGLAQVNNKGSSVSGKNGDQAKRCGANYYVYCPNGYGRTKLTNGYFEKLTGVSATTRNWRTVTALSAMLEE